MRILVTADIHANRQWHEWLLTESRKHDLLLIAGDILDMFSQSPEEDQIRDFLQWVHCLKSRHTLLALCSGNHDSASAPYCGALNDPELRELYFIDHWLEAIRDDTCVVSPENRLLQLKSDEKIVVSSLHWHTKSNLHGEPDKSGMHHESSILKQGKKLSSSHQCPWIWLHHEPPNHTRISEDTWSEQNNKIHQQVENYQPDVLCSGHEHSAPFLPNGSYFDRIGKTLCLNPGHRDGASKPCSITLDYSEKKFHHWHSQV